jgi:hypothetical protein
MSIEDASPPAQTWRTFLATTSENSFTSISSRSPPTASACSSFSSYLLSLTQPKPRSVKLGPSRQAALCLSMGSFLLWWWPSRSGFRAIWLSCATSDRYRVACLGLSPEHRPSSIKWDEILAKDNLYGLERCQQESMGTVEESSSPFMAPHGDLNASRVRHTPVSQPRTTNWCAAKLSRTYRAPAAA